MKILITNIASVTAVSIIKILKKGEINKLYIWGTEAQEYGYNSGSMLVDYYLQVPEVRSKFYTETIIKICKKYNIQILLPILDEELYLFSKSEIHRYVKILLPNIKTIQIFRNKLLASMEICHLSSQNVPLIYNEYHLVNSNKVIIRKRESIGSQGIIIKKSSELSISDFNNSGCFVQEYIEGSEYTVDVLADDEGHVKLIIPRERLQIKNGVSTKVQIIQDSKIINLCKMIYNNFYIPGLSNVQFIKKNDTIYFIELNMRFGGMGIASVLASYDYLSKYLLYLTSGKGLGEYSENMKKVKWGSVICRYYEETVLMGV